MKFIDRFPANPLNLRLPYQKKNFIAIFINTKAISLSLFKKSIDNLSSYVIPKNNIIMDERAFFPAVEFNNTYWLLPCYNILLIDWFSMCCFFSNVREQNVLDELGINYILIFERKWVVGRN